MSYDIYLCVECLGPIWFPFGQKMHVGTGWDCWSKQQERQGEGKDLVNKVGEFIFTTEPQFLKTLVAEARRLYEVWMPKSRKSQLLPFLRTQLRAGRGDVLHDFFRYLTMEPPGHVGPLVREITTTAEWKRFARRTVAREREPRRRAMKRRAR